MVVNVGATTAPDVRLGVAAKTEALTVVAETPLIDSTDTGVGEIITAAQIENLPLNGRQFGNLAALVPGVSLGFHTDPTKSTQFAPQVRRRRRPQHQLPDRRRRQQRRHGRRPRAATSRSTRSASSTSRRSASAPTPAAPTAARSRSSPRAAPTSSTAPPSSYFRDKSLNSQTTTEKNNEQPKGDYRRHQFGASLGGPIIKDKTHFFAAFERTKQDTTQSVSTLGLFPDKDGVYDMPYRENLAVAKLTHQFNSQNYLSVRYGYNDNSQPYGASPNTPPESWGLSKNTFHSVNANLNSSMGGGKLNEFVFQYSYFLNHIAENSNLPTETFPNGVIVGQSINTPQTTEQHKYQFRDDFTLIEGQPRAQGGRELHLRARRSTSRSRPASSRSTRTSPTAATRRSRTSATTARSAARAAAASAASRTTSTPSTSRTAGA